MRNGTQEPSCRPTPTRTEGQTIHTPPNTPGLDLTASVETLRRSVSAQFDDAHRSAMGQFMTPADVAGFMTSLFDARGRNIRVLDPGAGVGCLSAAFVAAVCARARRPETIVLDAYEVDPALLGPLRQTLDACRQACEAAGIDFLGEVRTEDFLEAGSAMVEDGLFNQSRHRRFDCVIMNPPYRKIQSSSNERRLLRRAGIETSNLYTGFVGLALKLLADGGELVAITPRSFCNGPYFKPFRKLLLATSALRRLHVFESRSRAFAEDDVLQENVIFKAVRGAARGKVTVSMSEGPGKRNLASRRLDQADLVTSGDPNFVIHLAPEKGDAEIAARVQRLPARLEHLGVEVSTGRVVDFRAGKFLRDDPGAGTAPLIYPSHIEGGFVRWPKLGGRKPNAIVDAAGTASLLIPSAVYVLVKRFSSKEERRRIVAAVYDPERLEGKVVGFENHLNYYHARGRGLPVLLAKGLAAYLNSTLVDAYFRQFSGHTQVNAADLRMLRYPAREVLQSLGGWVGAAFPGQAEIDRLLAAYLGPS